MRQPTQSVIFLFLEVLDSALQKNEPTSVQIFFFRKKKYKQTNKNSKTKSKYINARYSKPLSNFFSLLFKDGGEEKNQFAKDETPPQQVLTGFSFFLSLSLSFFNNCLLLFISEVVTDFGEIEIVAGTAAVDVEYIETSRFEVSGSVVRLRNE